MFVAVFWVRFHFIMRLVLHSPVLSEVTSQGPSHRPSPRPTVRHVLATPLPQREHHGCHSRSPAGQPEPRQRPLPSRLPTPPPLCPRRRRRGRLPVGVLCLQDERCAPAKSFRLKQTQDRCPVAPPSAPAASRRPFLGGGTEGGAGNSRAVQQLDTGLGTTVLANLAEEGVRGAPTLRGQREWAQSSCGTLSLWRAVLCHFAGCGSKTMAFKVPWSQPLEL